MYDVATIMCVITLLICDALLFLTILIAWWKGYALLSSTIVEDSISLQFYILKKQLEAQQ